MAWDSNMLPFIDCNTISSFDNQYILKKAQALNIYHVEVVTWNAFEHCLHLVVTLNGFS